MSRTHFLDALLHVAHLLHSDQERALGALGLSPARTAVMWTIRHEGPRKQRDLATALGVTPRHVTTLVDELIDEGWVTRSAHPDDRRAVLVELTAGGEELMRSMAREHRELATALTVGWSDAEVAELSERLDTVAGRVATLMREQRA